MPRHHGEHFAIAIRTTGNLLWYTRTSLASTYSSLHVQGFVSDSGNRGFDINVWDYFIALVDIEPICK